MQRQGDSPIEERLIGDSLTEHMDRVEATRDLWPGIRDRMSRRRRTKLPILVRVAAATAVVSLFAVMVIVRPWSLLDDSMSPFAAVAHAYDGLFELETVRYRVDGMNSSGQKFVQQHQVDMVNRIEHSVLRTDLSSVPGLAVGGNSRQEFLKINGKHYIRHSTAVVEEFASEQWVSESSAAGWALFPDAMRHPKEGYPWAPFSEFGGLGAVRTLKSLSTRLNSLGTPRSTASPPYTTGPQGCLRPSMKAICIP